VDDTTAITPKIKSKKIRFLLRHGSGEHEGDNSLTLRDGGSKRGEKGATTLVDEASPHTTISMSLSKSKRGGTRQRNYRPGGKETRKKKFLLRKGGKKKEGKACGKFDTKRKKFKADFPA